MARRSHIDGTMNIIYRRLNFHFPHLSTFVNIQNPSKQSITKIHPTTIPQMKPQNLKKNHPVNIGIAIKRNVASHVMNTRPMLIGMIIPL